jgi:CubicO group peptidase (beta-lactamase class C family)
MNFPLEESDPSSLGFHAGQLLKLEQMILTHIDEGRYPGAQFALARHGKLAAFRSYGNARTEPDPIPTGPDTLFLLFSNTKVLVSSAVWLLVEDGIISLIDPVAEYMPEFAANGKQDITVQHVMTHQGGFPNSNITRAAWADHALMREQVCAFKSEWPAGSRLHYHPRAAHYVLAMLIEAVTGRDYRDLIRERMIEPLGLGHELYLGVPADQQARCADVAGEPVEEKNTAGFREAGLPFGGSYGTARAQVAFYQMLIQSGRLNGTRILSPRMVEYLTTDFTGDRIDGYANREMHRALGPYKRGTGGHASSLGSIASPMTFGHTGIGTNVCWGDPSSGVSFTFLSNEIQFNEWGFSRFDRVSNIIHAAIE